MNHLDRVSKEDLETCVMDIMSSLKEKNPMLATKYQAELDDYMYHISMDEAKKIVMNMKPKSEKFTIDYVKSFLMEKENNFTEQTLIDYYLTMNMVYNDYQLLFEKFPTLNQKEGYYIMSKCFIDDVDGPSHKVAKYFLM